MKISKKCEYALRAVFDLAFRNSGQPIKTSEIARGQNIPPRFLEVILNELKHGGFVESQRGSTGGYVLAQPVDALTVGDIIEFLEGPISIAGNEGEKARNGFFPGDHAFGHLWDKVNSAVFQTCHAMTLAELVDYERAWRTATAPDYAI